MEIKSRDLIDFNKLDNSRVIQLISDLTSKMSYYESLPQKCDDDIKEILYDFLEDYED